jgi:hypothetical protein
MFASLGFLTGAYFAIKPFIKAEVSTTVLLWSLFVVLTALAALSYLALLRFARKRYREMEN